MKVNLSNYICSVPFSALEIHENNNSLCCGSWLLKELKKNVPLDTLWNSEEAKDIRKSVSDGTYRHCSKTQCPYLAKLIKLDGIGDFKPIYKKEELPKHLSENVLFETGEMKVGPMIVHMSFDKSCNYKCPSCRVNFIISSTNKIKEINSTIEEIENTFANEIVEFYVTASGDPFASTSFRNYLKNFDPLKYPKLKKIHLFTNASLWDKEMWESMPNIHQYVESCEISVDAGTKETYENVTRVGGKWETLIENLKFISTIPKLKFVKTSFVVQSSNYKEMETFLKLMVNIFGKKSQVFFGKINNWGTFTDGEYKLLKVWDVSHPEYEDFIKELYKVHSDPHVFHNLHEFIGLNKNLI